MDRLRVRQPDSRTDYKMDLIDRHKIKCIKQVLEKIDKYYFIYFYRNTRSKMIEKFSKWNYLKSKLFKGNFDISSRH